MNHFDGLIQRAITGAKHLRSATLKGDVPCDHLALDSYRRCWQAEWFTKKCGADQMMSSPAKFAGKEIRILIADDHPVVREGILTILALQSDLIVVGQARDGEEACLLYDELSPDILLLDLRMPKKMVRMS